MIERFDHAVIAVPDLEAGMAAFRRLGFEVAAGGHHPSLGTRNAIVRFGLDYLELLTVEDHAKARSRGPFGVELMAFLWENSGLIGFVLAGTGLEDEVAGFRAMGLNVEGPFDMDRIHPGGGRLQWRLVLPGGSPWRRPWPYLIDWVTDEAELLAWDPPGRHDCGVTGVAGIDLVVGELEAAEHIYEQALGLGAGRSENPWPGTRSRHYRIGSFRLGVHQPSERGPATAELNLWGPGPYRLVLSSADIVATTATLSRNGVPFDESPRGIDIDPEAAMGARLRVVPE